MKGIVRFYEGIVISRDFCNKTGKMIYHVYYPEDKDSEDLFEEQLRPLLCSDVSSGADPMLRAQRYIARRKRAIALFTHYPVWRVRV